MYSIVIDYIKNHLESSVDVQKIQSGYFGDFTEINLGRPAVLLEPKRDQKGSKSVRWNSGDYQVRVWIMVEMVRDYLTSMREIEQLMSPDDPSKSGVVSALKKLHADDIFRGFNGTNGGKAWRIGAIPLSVGDTTFSIQQTASQKINVAQVDIVIHFECEK